jgi:hypothetical protein
MVCSLPNVVQILQEKVNEGLVCTKFPVGGRFCTVIAVLVYSTALQNQPTLLVLLVACCCYSTMASWSNNNRQQTTLKQRTVQKTTTTTTTTINQTEKSGGRVRWQPVQVHYLCTAAVPCRRHQRFRNGSPGCRDTLVHGTSQVFHIRPAFQKRLQNLRNDPI